MAFAATIDSITVFGNKRIVMGSYTNEPGDTGGDIATGLLSVDFVTITPKVTTVAPTTGAGVNETLPLSGGTVTIVTADGEDGYFMVVGTGSA